jgi:hypothetical protein
MHNIKLDIAKLQDELSFCIEDESLSDSAINSMKNSGWTNLNGRWVNPSLKRMLDEFNVDSMSNIKYGDYVMTQGETNGVIWFVRNVDGNALDCSNVVRIDPYGISVTNNTARIYAHRVRVIDPLQHIGYVFNIK